MACCACSWVGCSDAGDVGGECILGARALEGDAVDPLLLPRCKGISPLAWHKFLFQITGGNNLFKWEH